MLSVGVLGFAYLMTGFSNFVSGTFTEEFGFFENHSKILSFMGSHKAPRDLVKSALQFLSFRRHQRSLAIQPHVLVEAPEALRSDLRMFANKRIVENSALLCNLDPALIAAVISRCEISCTCQDSKFLGLGMRVVICTLFAKAFFEILRLKSR